MRGECSTHGEKRSTIFSRIGKPKHRSENNIKVDLKKRVYSVFNLLRVGSYDGLC
jgi:hypothetical protein